MLSPWKGSACEVLVAFCVFKTQIVIVVNASLLERIGMRGLGYCCFLFIKGPSFYVLLAVDWLLSLHWILFLGIRICKKYYVQESVKLSLA